MADNLEDKVKILVEDWAVKVQQSAIDTINKTVDYSGGQSTALAGTVETEVSVVGSGQVRFVLKMADYYKFIEHGRSPNSKQPPTKPIEKFIRVRNLKLTPPKTLKGKAKSLSYDKQVKSLAFIIARSIGKKGIKAKPFVDDIITPELQTELKQGLAEAFKEYFIIDINK